MLGVETGTAASAGLGEAASVAFGIGALGDSTSFLLGASGNRAGNGLERAARFFCVLARLRGIRRGRGVHYDWKFNDECGATFRAIEAEDVAVVILNDAVANTEAEARAFADRFRGEERVKDMLRGGHTWPRVRKIHDHL